MAAFSSTSSPRALVGFGILGGWLLFTLMVIAISWAGSLLRSRAPDFAGVLIWNMGWLLWAGMTFVVARLGRRFPLERANLLRRITLHAGFGIGISIALLAGEFLFAHGLGRVWPGAPRPNAFLGFIVYKFHVYFLIYWMVLGATRAYDFYARFREQELLASQLETQLAQAQLHALQTQLQPHFLFNTHHAIISLILKQDHAAAISMLTRLSDLLRLTLHRPDQQLSSLREELDGLELYLGIQRDRFGNRLNVQYDIPSAAMTAEVPWLSLQPLVENALKHGIEGLDGNGMLRISAHLGAERLQLSVTDNGPGFPAHFSLEAAGGIGLRNLRARLARLYGSKQDLEIHHASTGGAEVRITLPLRAYLPPPARPMVAAPV